MSKSNKKKTPRILIWDIETSFAVAATFSLYPNSISHNHIIQDPYIICGCYKWLGEDTVYAVKVTKGELKQGNDKRVVQKLCDAVRKADAIVAHNGDKFDLKWLKGRALKHGLEPLKYTRTIDTLKVARKHFKLMSNRLDYLGQFLLGEGKMHTSAGLWMKVLHGDMESLQEMVEYNKIDVVVLEKVYLKLRPWMTNHPNLATSHSQCKACDSEEVCKYGLRVTKSGIKYQKFQCRTCGHVFTDTKRLRED
jgi:DNA polymerase III alpha subunit (gram-positive type)